MSVSDQRLRDKHATIIKKEISINDEIYLVPYKQYHFVSNINHGLAREFGVLPSDIPFRFRFHRAPKEFVLLKLSNTVEVSTKAEPMKKIELDFSYPEPVVPIINPVLRCYYAYSQSLSSKMSRISSHAFQTNFVHYECRQQILDTALDEYIVPLGQGPLPKTITFSLASLDRTRGNEQESLTRFCPLDLVQFDVVLSMTKIPFKVINNFLRSRKFARFSS